MDIACWAAITLSGLYYLALLPFRASLVGTHPKISVLLNGSTEAIVSAAAYASKGHGSLIVLLIVGIIGTMKFDIIYWWAGGCGASGSSSCSPAGASGAGSSSPGSTARAAG